ncbi:MAG: hypothetical protein R3Y07_01240 [Eubacteriales bacterium]
MSKKKTSSDGVVRYIGVLFGMAFLLLLMTYFMEHRQSAEAIEGLRSSVSAMETAEQLRIKNEELSAKLDELESQASQFEAELYAQKEQFSKERLALEAAINEGIAMQLYYQILLADGEEQEELILQMVEGNLGQYLSDQIPEGQSLSPGEHFLEHLR